MLHSRSLRRLLALTACCVALQAHADPRYSVTVVGTADSAGYGINASGQVVGWLTTLGGDQHAFLYDNVGTLDLGTLGSGYAEVFDINNHSQVVGTSGGFALDGGFLYEGSGLISLNTLIDPTSGWFISDARAINDAGQIAGTACQAGVCYAVRLDLVSPVPEPASTAMLASGLALLGMGARRRRYSAVRRANSSGNSTTSSILRR